MSDRFQSLEDSLHLQSQNRATGSIVILMMTLMIIIIMITIMIIIIIMII